MKKLVALPSCHKMLLLLWISSGLLPIVLATYQVGVGRADMTGPSAEITLVSHQIQREAVPKSSKLEENFNIMIEIQFYLFID